MGTANDTWIFEAGGDNLIAQFEYDGSNNVIYQGVAKAGSSTSQSVWRIRKFTYDGSNNVLNWGFANGSPAFVFVWDNRSTYTYL